MGVLLGTKGVVVWYQPPKEQYEFAYWSHVQFTSSPQLLLVLVSSFVCVVIASSSCIFPHIYLSLTQTIEERIFQSEIVH